MSGAASGYIDPFRCRPDAVNFQGFQLLPAVISIHLVSGNTSLIDSCKRGQDAKPGMWSETLQLWFFSVASTVGELWCEFYWAGYRIISSGENNVNVLRLGFLLEKHHPVNVRISVLLYIFAKVSDRLIQNSTPQKSFLWGWDLTYSLLQHCNSF